MHGQEIAEEIARRKGEKPSPGTIYLALKNLREMGFIVGDEKEGKTITYAITDRGKNALRISKRRFMQIFLEFSHKAAIAISLISYISHNTAHNS
jgi:PadR family transcriptional regulator PadR